MNWFEKIKWNIQIKWIQFIIKYELTKLSKIKRKYCAKGFHKVKIHNIRPSKLVVNKKGICEKK